MAAAGRGGTLPVLGERLRQAADLLVGQEPLAALAAVSPDALARVGVLGPEAHRLGLAHDDGEDGQGPVGGGRSPPPGVPRNGAGAGS